MSTSRGMVFTIDFHGPIRVGTGEPGATGADLGCDPDDPVPATSIKGAMRATAAKLCADSLVDEVFGTRLSPSPWSFSGATNLEWHHEGPTVRSQVAIDDTTGTAESHALFSGEELWPARATVRITPLVALDEDTLERHRSALLIAAAGTHALGGARRRGLGWVTIRPAGEAGDDLAAQIAAALPIARGA